MAGRLSERDRAAVHEAAHVLVGWLVGLDAKAVTVIDVQSLGNHHGATVTDVPGSVPPAHAMAMFAAGAVAEQGYFENSDPNDWAEDTQTANFYLALRGITDPAVQADCFAAGFTVAATLLANHGDEWAAVAKALSEGGAIGAEKLGMLKGRILVLGPASVDKITKT